VLGSVLSAIGLAALRIEARAVARRVARRAALAAVTGVLLLTALGFALGALTVWLAQLIGAIAALLTVAGGLIVIAAIIQIAGRMGGSRRKPRAASAPPPRAASVRPTEPAPDADEPPPGSALGSVAVVAVAGFLLARQMFRRRPTGSG
jgi:hypothetical protein